MTDAADEEGGALVLAVGFALLTLMVAALAIDATDAYLRHRRVQHAADAAALAAAGQVDEARLRATGGAEIALDAEAARRAAARTVAATELPAGTRWDLRVRDERVEVVVQAPGRGILLGLLGVDPPTIRAAATARLRAQDP